MKVALPNDQWAVLIAKEAITEGQNRAITRALMRNTAITVALEAQGYKDDDPTTYHIYNDLSDEDKDAMADAKIVLAVNLVSSWSFNQEITPEGCLALPAGTLDQLGAECVKVFSPPEVDLLDPKAATDASPG